MRAFTLAAAAFSALIGFSQALPLIVHPGTAQDLVITAQDTVNGTLLTNSSSPAQPPTAGTQQLELNFINNLGGGQVNAYVTGSDPNNQVVMLQPDGTWYYPSAGGATTPQPINANVAIPLGGQGSTTSIKLPDYISAARIWFAVGNLQFFVVQAGNGQESLVEPSAVNPSDPSAGVNWGFVELTNTADGGIYANISYVDFVGLVLGMSLQGSQGTQTALGLQADAVSQICNDLAAQTASDGQPWAQMCLKDGSGNPLRILSPQDYLSVDSNAFSNYWTDYINQVWSTYSSSPLTINTQASAGDVSCTVSGGTLNCDGDNRGYAQPTAGDIFGCNSGPFGIQAGDNAVHYAVVPRLCAAFDRSTLLINGGNVQPGPDSSTYYSVNPTNHYSRIVHKYEVDGKGYAFSYDDVNPSGENQSGVVSDPNPTSLTITVGGPS